MSHGGSSAPATRIGSAARAAGASANASLRSLHAHARLIRRPARGAVRGPAGARAPLAGHPSHPLRSPAQREGEAPCGVMPHTGPGPVLQICGQRTGSVRSRGRRRTAPCGSLKYAGRGWGGASREPPPSTSGDPLEFARAPRPAAANSEAGRARAAGGRETHRPARSPLPKRRDGEAGSLVLPCSRAPGPSVARSLAPPVPRSPVSSFGSGSLSRPDSSARPGR